MPENVVLCHMWLLRTIYSNGPVVVAWFHALPLSNFFTGGAFNYWSVAIIVMIDYLLVYSKC